MGGIRQTDVKSSGQQQALGLKLIPQEKTENRLGGKGGEQKGFPISSLLLFWHQPQGNTLVHWKAPMIP